MRHESLFLLLMGRELMVTPGGWRGGVGNARTQDQEDPGPQYQGPFQE